MCVKGGCGVDVDVDVGGWWAWWRDSAKAGGREGGCKTYAGDDGAHGCGCVVYWFRCMCCVLCVS